MKMKLCPFFRSSYFLAIGICVLLIIVLVIFTFFFKMSYSHERRIVYIDRDDTIDSVYHKVSIAAENNYIHGFKILARYSHYPESITTGAYALEPNMSAWTFFRRVRGGRQEPVDVIVPVARTYDTFAQSISRQLMIDSLEVLQVFRDSALCESLGYTPATLPAMIVPNTYNMYWDVSVEDFFARLKKEHTAFWNLVRQEKARDLGLTPLEVSILASIVNGETMNEAEMPTIAGLYYNRLQKNMLLQADPTVVFANNAWGTRRVYAADTKVDSPYNTYRYKGLPPGPIRIPTVAAIDAVLNMEHHNYLYMCAKEDFSGTHNFAATYDEHKANAKRYKQALDARGIN